MLAGTLSTVIVFLPIIFGEESEICDLHGARRSADRGRDAGVPACRADHHPDADRAVPAATRRSESGSLFARMQDWYLRRLDWLFDHKWWAALFVVLTVLSPVPLFATGLVKMDMFPQDASDRLFLPYHIEGTYPLARIEEAVTRVETVPRAEQGALRHRPRLQLLPARRRVQRDPAEAARRAADGATRADEGDREGHARDHHRQAELPLRRGTGSAPARSACA